MMKLFDAASRSCLVLAAIASALATLGIASGRTSEWQAAAVVASTGFAVGFRAFPALRPFQFTAWVVAAVVAGMIYPQALVHIGRDQEQKKWIMLLVIQLVMFGMGTQMRLRELASLRDISYAVVVGALLQFTVMPVVGYSLATAAKLPPEVAAGVVLVGSCSSGLASNVMNYLAGANLALSITLTTFTTLMAPVMTPLWMKVLVGRHVDVSFVGMMIDILKITFVPLAAALLDDYLNAASPAGRRRVWAIVAAGAAWLGWLASGGWSLVASHFGPGAQLGLSLIGFALAAAVFGVAYHEAVRRAPSIKRWMPVASMCGIVFFTAVTTASGRDELLVVGWLLLAVAIAHNVLGYTLGYWLSRAFRLDKRSARTVAIEVGLQNGGMASGIANAMGKLGTVGLAAAIFSPWMNVSGSILANYWRKRPIEGDAHPPAS